jgi:glycosyltransferase involved in cell wall biosynthesis
MGTMSPGKERIKENTTVQEPTPDFGLRSQSGDPAPSRSVLQGKRVAMVTFSSYPADPRPRRAVEALLMEGMSIDLVCLADENAPQHERDGHLDVLRLPIRHRRGSVFSYAYNYFAFIVACSIILAQRAIRQRYDLVYVHNMPDVLVLCGLVPQALGAKVVLDLHDPMPELLMTIFNLREGSWSVGIMKWLEKWSIACADAVVTVNIACKRIFTSRSCQSEKIGVVMNSPDSEIFPFRAPQPLKPGSGAPNKRFVIMYHGSLVERNGLNLAVEALARVRNTVPAAELRIYGRSSPFLDRVMAQVNRQHLEDCVSYLGPKRLEDLVGAIEDCDVGVVPNERNAFTDINTPTRIFEYLALGKPVIAPRTPGIQDYFNAESLFFFESGNSQELAEKIAYVSSHFQEAIDTAKRGQGVYRAHTWPQEKATLVHLVSRLFDKKSSARSELKRVQSTRKF